MIIEVEEVEMQPGNTIATGHGYEPESGDHVVFAGDWRAMEGLMLMVEDMGTVTAEIEDWQVLSREPAAEPQKS